jgi:hypothetical protein
MSARDRKVEEEKEEKNSKKQKHYTPRGTRSSWTEAQYTVYKEEQKRFRDRRWKSRKAELVEMAEEMQESKKRLGAWIDDGGRNRTVLAVIDGRKNGQPAVQKDERGLPVDTIPAVKAVPDAQGRSVVNKQSSGGAISNESDQAALQDDSPSEVRSGKAQPKVKAGRGRKRRSEASDAENTTKADQARAKKPKIKKTPGKWVVPDSSDDEGDSHDENRFMREQGLSVVHDYWPSMWRSACAVHVNMKRTNKTVS